MKYYPHHIGDFDRATRHLTRVERSIYRDLIELYYDTEKPLNLDIQFLCRRILARTNEESTAVEQTLNEFFIKTDDGWFHSRCDTEIEKFFASNSQKSQAGKASAAKRALKKQQALNGRSTNVQRACNGTPTIQEPRTKNQEPRTNNKKPLSIPSTDVADVFSHWQFIMESPKSKLDNTRSNLITKSLKLGYSVADLKSAIDGCRATPYNMGANDRNTKYNGLDLIFRSADHIDRFIQTVRNGAGNGQVRQGGAGNQQRDNSAAGRVAANIARERAERETIAAGLNRESMAVNGEDVRPQMDQQLWGSSGPRECLGGVLEGDYERTD